MQSIRFEWDDAKDRANLRKHGLSFAEGAEAFTEPFSILRADRVVDGEERLQTLAMLRGVLLLLIMHTLWEETEDELQVEVVRIISVRYATPHERRFYEDENG